MKRETSGKVEKPQEMANMKATEGKFIYIGPSTKTGLIENTIFTGTKEDIEEYLKGTLEKIPQARQLIVESKNLAECRAKVKKAGTILNKYYNDILSLSRAKEG